MLKSYKLIKAKLSYLFLLALLLFVSIVATPVWAQTIPQNLSGVNIDSYSDTQLNNWLQQAKASGISDNDLVKQAQDKGLSEAQAQRLQTRIAAIRSGNSGTKASDDNTNAVTQTQQRQVSGADDTLPAAPVSSKIFGADLFRNSKTSFAPNLRIATPMNYILGPDDEVVINVYGNSLVNWKLPVSPEGNINIPGVGLLNVSGKTIEQATANIKSKLAANNYAVGRGTSVEVSLGNIRSISVIVNGQVIKPGTITVPSLATVFYALTAAGGPNDNGSFRNIEIIRNNKVVRHLDLYDFLLKGSQVDNISLKDQDIIRVPTYRLRVEMAGQVKVPALFEVLPGETLQDVLRFAGGFTESAYTDKIKVYQISGQERKIADIVEADYANYTPLRGDRYEVDAILERFENRVTIQGAVFRPGAYELSKGLTLSALIKKAAGIKEDAFTGRGFITRLKDDNSTESISFSPKGILDKSAPDIVLKREDVVDIRSIFDLRDNYTVTIKGGVRAAGEFAYADSMTVEDLILKAGGLSEGASTSRIQIARRVSNSDPNSLNSDVAKVFSINIDAVLKPESANFKLKPYDIVSVYSLPGYEKQRSVKVIGEVLYPGYYTIRNKSTKISDIIKEAGGLTVSADVEGASLKRSNLAILGVNKDKGDAASIKQDRIDRINKVKLAYNDSTLVETQSARNDFVGIDLKTIIAKPGSKIDLLVEDEDEISIPKEQQIVKVDGDVLYPSAIIYTSGKTLKGYVINAGGYSPTALKRGAYVLYPNGTVKGSRKFLFFTTHPSIRPGSIIYVPKKAERKGLTTQETVGLAASVASLGAVILGIITLSRK